MMAMALMNPNRFPDPRRLVCALLALVSPVSGFALPDDDAQQVVFGDSASIELSLNEGEVIQTAHADRPTCITQGSRVICGAEIRFTTRRKRQCEKGDGDRLARPLRTET